MREPDEPQPRYYFALPRLVARLGGGSARRSEQNGLEAAVAGTLVHAVTYLFAVRLLIGHRSTFEQVLLLLPVALLVLASWSVIIYANALLIRGVRAAGVLRGAPDRHLQSACIAAATTLFAWQLIAAGSWMRLLGLAWMMALVLNLAAAAVLALMHAEPVQ